MINAKVNLIVDLQYGSTGKGLLAGYLAETTEPDTLVTCNMPNAGHTYIDSCGNKMIFKVLPNGIVSGSCEVVMIGPGAVFDMDRLEKEVVEAVEVVGRNFRIFIHPNAVILTEEHAKTERSSLNQVSSTMQGSAAAMIQKMMRQLNNNPTARAMESVLPTEIAGVRVTVATPDEWVQIISNARVIQAEGSQGFSLGIHQRFYPYCTSRECTPHRMLSDMGLPMNMPGLTVWGSLRTFPIRVGNTTNGYSGDCYDDQHEISWEELGVEPELTTVTQRVRRVFTFSRNQLKEALWYSRPDKLFLNFCNYMDPPDLGRLVDAIELDSASYGAKLELLGYGPTYDDVRSYSSR